MYDSMMKGQSINVNHMPRPGMPRPQGGFGQGAYPMPQMPMPGAYGMGMPQ